MVLFMIWFIYLDKADVSSFDVISEEDLQNVTKDEHDIVSFKCVVSSKPASYIKIQHDNVTVSKTETGQFKLEYNKSQSSCADTGVYRCIAWNEYNIQPAVSRHIQFFIRCEFYA